MGKASKQFLGIILAILTCFFSGNSIEAFQIDSGLNDAWVDPAVPGQGFFITVFPDLGLMFLAWFTFDSVPASNGVTAVFGSPDQRWLTGIGAYEGNTVTLSVELTTGGVFIASTPVATQSLGYGTIVIEFIDCGEALLTYDFPSAMLSGQMTVTRVLPDNIATCIALSGT
ncbi:MAG: hypothetical protein ACI9H8_000992 [Lysobacterales bacterium]|jgi:hypothetical protein